MTKSDESIKTYIQDLRSRGNKTEQDISKLLGLFGFTDGKIKELMK